MFSKKYTVTLLDSKWQVLGNKIKLDAIPRKDEFIWHSGLYHRVFNVVHSTEKKQGIYIILEPVGEKIN
jgi:hypothetical protein